MSKCNWSGQFNIFSSSFNYSTECNKLYFATTGYMAGNCMFCGKETTLNKTAQKPHSLLSSSQNPQE